MAHEIQELDNVMLGSGLAAWHGLGTVVQGQPDSAAALQLAGLDWGVGKEELWIADGQGGFVVAPNAYATVRDDLPRTDPRRVLGCVTGRYSPIDNRECFRIIDDLCDQGARFETAGSLRNGKLVWMLARAPQDTDVKGDRISRYLLVTTSHDGTRSVEAKFTPIRVVCSNTLHWALGWRTSRTAKIRHFGDTDKQILTAKEVLGLAGEYFEEHEKVSRKLADTKLDRRFAAAYLQALWPDAEPDGSKHPQAEKTRNRIMDLYNGAQKGGGHPSIDGTAYGLANAVSEYVDHERRTVAMGGRDKLECRFESVMWGTGAKVKNEAVGLLCRQLDLDGTAANLKAQAAIEAKAKAVDDLLGSIDLGANN